VAGFSSVELGFVRLSLDKFKFLAAELEDRYVSNGA